jgi:hypothetical protein
MQSKKNLPDKWAPILGITQSEKLDWLSEYANQQDNTWKDTTIYGSATGSLSSLQSKENFPSLLPVAIKVAAKTIGLDLVSVNPIMGGGDPKLLEAAKNKVKSVNRERQMDSIIEDDKPFEPLKIEDTEEYKEYNKYSGPKMGLLYIDFQYGTTSSTNINKVIN